MDFRHYTGNTHVVSAYEGFDEMRSDPTGIANTNDISLSCFSQMPSDDVLNALADKWQAPPLLICEPDVYYESKALGVWSVIDTADPVKKELEEQLDAAFLFYQKKWSSADGTGSGTMGTSCIRMTRSGICGGMISAGTRGKIMSSFRPCGYGRRFSAPAEKTCSEWLKQ